MPPPGRPPPQVTSDRGLAPAVISTLTVHDRVDERIAHDEPQDDEGGKHGIANRSLHRPILLAPKAPRHPTQPSRWASSDRAGGVMSLAARNAARASRRSEHERQTDAAHASMARSRPS